MDFGSYGILHHVSQVGAKVWGVTYSRKQFSGCVVRNRIRRTTFYRISRWGSRGPKEMKSIAEASRLVVLPCVQASTMPCQYGNTLCMLEHRHHGTWNGSSLSIASLEPMADAHARVDFNAPQWPACIVCRERESLLLGTGAESARLPLRCMSMTRQLYGRSQQCRSPHTIHAAFLPANPFWPFHFILRP